MMIALTDWILILACTLATTRVVRTKDPESNSVGSKENQLEPDDANSSTRRVIGRHVCAKNKIAMKSLKEVQSFCKSTQKSYLRRCDKRSSQYCTAYRVVYERAFRPTERMVAKTETTYNCCPGWAKSKPYANDCRKALCSKNCQNGGSCAKPDQCFCAYGYTGAFCETKLPAIRSRSPNTLRNITDEFELYKRRLVRLEQHMSQILEFQIQMKNVTDNLLERYRTDPGGGTQKKAWAGDSVEDRMNSLSDQIAILEERLADCSCTQRDHQPRVT